MGKGRPLHPHQSATSRGKNLLPKIIFSILLSISIAENSIQTKIFKFVETHYPIEFSKISLPILGGYPRPHWLTAKGCNFVPQNADLTFEALRT